MNLSTPHPAPHATQAATPASGDFILVAVADPVVRPEAAQAAAVTGAQVVEAEDPRDIARLAPRARKVLVCAQTARHVAHVGRRAGLYLVGPDPGPLDYEAAMRCHAEQAFLLPAQATELLAALGQAPSVPRERHLTIGVTGACGGVGTSTLAAALARHIAPHHPTVLVDAIHGSGGLDLLMGVESGVGARWPDLQLGAGTIDPAGLRGALPTTPDGVAVLSAARTTIADPFTLTLPVVERVLDALAVGEGVTVVDCPRGMIPQAVDHVVVLTAAEVRPAATATAMLAQLHADNVPHQLVLRHRGWSGLEAAEVETITRTDVSAEVPHIRNLTRRTEVAGLPQPLPRPLAQACDLIVAEAGWAL